MPETNLKLKKNHGKFTRGKSMAVKGSPHSSEELIEDINGKKTYNNLYIFYTCHIGRLSVVSDLRSRLPGGLGGTPRAHKICEDKRGVIGYVLDQLKL